MNILGYNDTLIIATNIVVIKMEVIGKFSTPYCEDILMVLGMLHTQTKVLEYHNVPFRCSRCHLHGHLFIYFSCPFVKQYCKYKVALIISNIDHVLFWKNSMIFVLVSSKNNQPLEV